MYQNKLQTIQILVLLLFLAISPLLHAQWTFEQLNTGSNATFNSISSFSDNLIFVFGNGGVILKSTNKGATWSTEANSITDNLLASSFHPTGFGWVIGANGRALKTTDFGQTWIVQQVGTTTVLNAVYSWDNNSAVVCGTSGTIYKTTNGGATWKKKDIYGSGTLRSISFCDEFNGFLTGGDFENPYRGFIFRTTDGGDNWVKCFEIGSIFTGIQTLSPSLVYSCGIQGQTVVSTNSGASWNSVLNSTSQWLYALKMFNNEDGLFFGGNIESAFYSTKNRKTGWENTTIYSTGQWLYASAFPNPNLGFVAGFGGRIYRFNRSPQSDLTIISPFASSIFPSGVEKKILWTRTTVAKIKIEYSTNNGNNWITIINNQPTENGFYNWQVPYTPSTTCRLRISDVLNSFTSYTNPGTFTIKSEKNLLWMDSLSVSDSGNYKQVLLFGQSPVATDGIDPSLGEFPLPPLPPTGVFDARLQLPITPVENSYIDFRNDTVKSCNWIVKFQPSFSGYPITLKWNPAALNAGLFRLKDAVTGSIVNIDMKTQNSYTLTNTGINSLIIQFTSQACKGVSLNSGWNIVSVPVSAENMNVTTLFPAATSPAWGFNTGYVQSNSLVPGSGYWLRYPNNAMINLCGNSVGNASIQLSAGWNLIGVFDKDNQSNQVVTTPPGIITSPFYSYNNGYQVSEILTGGKGYWVRTNQNGIMNFQTSQVAKDKTILTDNKIESTWGQITFTDSDGKVQLLYANQSSQAIPDKSRFDLPPIPPSSVFDVRFSTNRNLTELTGSLNSQLVISGAKYPVEISFRNVNVLVTDNINGKFLNKVINGEGTISVENESLNILNITSTLAPLSFEVDQNYPNPFNPTTTISYRIPETGKVKVIVYDISGIIVKQLYDGMQEAGSYKLEWDSKEEAGFSASSGVYFYRVLHNDSFVVRKMLLLK